MAGRRQQSLAEFHAARMQGQVRESKERPRPIALMDATPERLAKGDWSELMDPRTIDDKEQRNGTTARRFKSSTLDRLHRNEKITWFQWYAGDWYRDCHAAAIRNPKTTASYGQSQGQGETDYGMPVTEKQAIARDKLRRARDQWPLGMQGFMDRLLIHDKLPRYAGRKAMRQLSEVRKALDILARYLRMEACD